MGTREIVVLLAGVVLVNACGRKEPPEQPAPEPVATETPAPNMHPAPAPVRQEQPAAPDDGAAALRATLEQRIHFEFNSAELTSTAKETLGAKASALTTDPSIRLRIEGHADERGSDEYNLALGSRRAAAAMKYLVSRGVPATRLETVSYGEERPLDARDGESAWAQNRRDEFQVTGGISSR
jgi:peptidoglycan-associated lipoprotein